MAKVKITIESAPEDVEVIFINPTPPEKTYVPFPTAPVFANEIPIAGNQSITASMLAGKNEIQLSGKAQSLTLNSIGGSAEKPIRFSGGEVEGSSTTQRSVRTLNNTLFVELNKMKLKGNDGGFMLSAGTTPAGAMLSDVEIIEPGFAGYWCNSNGQYKYLNSQFLRVKKSGGEAEYLGNTDRTKRSTIQQSHHKHLLVLDSGWDGIQVTSVADLHINKFTVIGAGLKNQVGQNTLMQLQMVNGLVENGIMIGGSSSISLFAHGLTLRNIYANWLSEDSVYIGEASGEPQLNGQPLTIDGITFNVPGSKPLFQVAMRGADVIVKNCIISDNRKGLFTDARGTGATNKLVDGGGNQFVPASQIKVPEFKTLDGEPVVTDDYYYSKGFGYRTP